MLKKVKIKLSCTNQAMKLSLLPLWINGCWSSFIILPEMQIPRHSHPHAVCFWIKDLIEYICFTNSRSHVYKHCNGGWKSELLLLCQSWNVGVKRCWVLTNLRIVHYTAFPKCDFLKDLAPYYVYLNINLSVAQIWELCIRSVQLRNSP